MKKLLSVLTAVTVFLSTFYFFGCAPKGSAVDLRYFNTVVRIETHDGQMNSSTINLIKDALGNIENSFSATATGSIVERFNSGMQGTAVTLNKDGLTVFNKAKEFYDFTNGLFDPSVYPLVKLWQFSPYDPNKDLIVPTQNQISDALNRLDFSSVIIDNDKLIKGDNDTEIDLGGIVKGYASDVVSDILHNAGHYKGYVSIGGSSLKILSTDAFSIKHPRASQNAQTLLTFNCNGKTDLSVSTSGDYQRYHVKDGILYSHLIDPSTGYPSQTGIISATVIANDGAFTDAITTALCLIEHTPNQVSSSPLCALIKKIITLKPDSKVFAVYLNGNTKQLITNAKKGEDFTLLDTDYSIVAVY